MIRLSYNKYWFINLFRCLCCCFVKKCRERKGTCLRMLNQVEILDAAREKLAQEIDMQQML